MEPSDPVLPESVINELLGAIREIPCVAAPTALRDRVLAAACDPVGAEILVVRAHEGEWHELAPGFTVKVLFEEGRTRTFLARMRPGASFPAHAHAEHEECMVLEGDLEGDGIALAAGDYQVALRGSTHGVVHTRQGCLLLLRAARC